MGRADEEMEEVQRRMAGMHAMALASLHASRVLLPRTPHPPPAPPRPAARDALGSR